MPMPWKPSKRKGTMPSATATDPVARMESMLLTPLKAKPDEPVPPMPWRGKRSRGGGYAALMPTIDEFFGTSNQVCGGFWPFGTDMALPAEGVPVGRSLMTGAGVCCDPISWFKAGIIKQPSMFLLGLPAIGKSTFVRREVLGLSALGMNAIIPGDLKPDYASLVNMLGGQVIRLGAGIGVVNPLDPGDLHYALQRLEGEARKDLTDYYNDTRAALMEVLLTIMRTGREADDVGGARGVTARESDILSVAVRVLHDRHGGDPQPPVIADLRDLLREGPDEVRMAAVWDDPENDELYRAQVRGLLADLHGFSNRMTKFGRLFGNQTTARKAMASRLIEADRYRKGMSPGYPLGLNIVDNTSMSTSWEDMAIVLAGPRSGKSLCYAIPAVLSAPGPCLATSNKGDILDVTAPIRRLDHPNGEIWTFDPERIADPNRKSAPWVWDLIASVQSIADAKRIADCWRYASGQPQTGGDDFFPGTAAQQLADYLFAAHLGGRSVSDVFRWCSNERDTSPADILSEYPRYAGIASRVSSVIALTPETRSGVFGSLQTMVAFLADPEIIDWIDPHRDAEGNIDERRGLFDPYEFATSEDTLYLLSAQGRPSTALTASLTAVVAFTAFQRAQSEFTGNNRRLPVPLCCVLDEAANICRWPELADVYSYFGSAGIPIMTIWQNLATIPGTLYKIRLKHASLCKDNVDQMQVVINGTPIEMTRVTANGKAGDKVGEKSTTIGTRVTNENRWHHSDQWETYEGYYVIPDGQTTTRFGFKAVNYLDPTKGNLLDDVTFARAYKLSYDKNASDATGSVPSNQRGKENTVQPAEARGTGTVKTVADGDSSKSLTVNPGFDVPDYSKLNDGGLHWMYVNPAEGKAWSYYDYINPAQPVQQVAGLSQATFGWQELTGGDHKTTAFELHREKDGNVCADVHGSRTIGQTIDTQAGVAYTVSIRHSGRSKGNAGSVQVLVGPDRDHLRPLEMSRMNVSRTGAKYGDRIGSVGTVVTTHSDSVDSTEGDHPAWDHADDWETYSGTYVATGGKTVFAYRGVDKNGDSVIDDLSFKLAYRLTYDKNAQDAAGSVPSSQYGKENTVQPAKAKTTGSVRLAADKTASGLTVHDLKNGEIAPVQYGDFKFSTVNGFSADQVTNVNGFTVKTNSNPFWEALYTDGTSTAYFPTKNGASLVLHHVGQWRDSSGTQRWLNARITVNGQNLGFLYYEAPTHHFNIGYGKWDKKPSSRPYMDVTVDFLLDDGSTPQGLRGVTGFTDLDGGTSGYNEGVELVSGFDGAYVRSDAHLTRFGTNGWAGTTDENAEVADEHGMKHYVGATFTGSSFRVRWSVASGQARAAGFQPVDSTIAYRLTYNKNAQDATGSIPSDTAANTTQPAKSETDGKVSDLVQRTTTHEDGSVTVKTIDTSTDVVSGCQVYYPAGQRITLATMAKDDDCWDSSMLSRPDHTQLGWNQDRNATQAQAQVTMVEGGMTVYAVWVGNPVLTYDTNKPSTWSGQMPSTPASVSVAYNTAAADGSGWAAGDTSKIRGYKFLGWYTAPQDNTGLYQWATPLTGNVTVYAHWQRLQANVIYNANGGTGSHPNTTGWQYSDVTIPGDTSKSFKRDKYVFKGWGTKPGKADVVYKDGSKVALQDKDITLYAQWQEVHENFVETGGIGLPIAIAGGVLLLMFGIGSTVMLTRRMNGHGMPDDE